MKANTKIYSLSIWLVLLFTFGLGVTCKAKHPVSIVAGEHSCAYCRMHINDLRFNTQAVNVNGKIKHYDSIECLVRHTQNPKESNEYSHRYVKNFANKENFVNAIDAYYLQSTQLASPMGSGLSAYASVEEQEKAYKKYTGQKLDFSEIFSKIEKEQY